ncbi:MAG: hypothetical protein QOG90_1434 [Actinomycetota bacterium]
MTAVAHFPASFDKGFLERFRRPLSALAATILVVDLMGLGMHLADSAESPFANDAPTRAKVRVGGPEAVVPNTSVAGAGADRRAARTVEPLGCLAISSGCYAGPAVSSTPPTGSNTATPQGNGGGSTTPNAAKPIAQADVAVPALGAQVSVGVGDGGCTGLDLTLLAVGGCPAPTGDGPVIVKLGGSLLGD